MTTRHVPKRDCAGRRDGVWVGETSSRGSVQRLPNGNTLIVESDGGRAFEVTPDKKIVWEFYNPHRAGENDALIASLFDLIRLPAADDRFAAAFHR